MIDDVDGAERRCFDIATIDDGLQLLRACATDSDDMAMLRGAVRDSDFALSRMTNYQVLDVVAGMIARRQLCVVAVRTVHGTVLPTAKKAPARSVAQTPSQYRPRIDVPVEVDEVPNVPAAMLIEAARTGAPFCEH